MNLLEQIGTAESPEHALSMLKDSNYSHQAMVSFAAAQRSWTEDDSAERKFWQEVEELLRNK